MEVSDSTNNYNVVDILKTSAPVLGSLIGAAIALVAIRLQNNFNSKNIRFNQKHQNLLSVRKEIQTLYIELHQCLAYLRQYDDRLRHDPTNDGAYQGPNLWHIKTQIVAWCGAIKLYSDKNLDSLIEKLEELINPVNLADRVKYRENVDKIYELRKDIVQALKVRIGV